MKLPNEIEMAIAQAVESARKEGFNAGRKQVIDTLVQTLDGLLEGRKPVQSVTQAQTQPQLAAAVTNPDDIRVVRHAGNPIDRKAVLVRGSQDRIHHKGPHWTQKPENAAKLQAVINKMNSAKKPKNGQYWRSPEARKLASERAKAVWAKRSPQKRAAIRRKQRETASRKRLAGK